MQIIILIIIIALVISNNKKKAAQSSQRKDSFAQNSTNYSYGNKKAMPTNNNSAYQKSTYQNNSSQNSTYRNGSRPATMKEEPKGKEGSTLEYLNKKAEEDRIEHLEEKRQAAMKHKQMYGNAVVGERMMLGDAIPRGMIQVNCPYCAAENLIQPKNRGNSLCYFCKTKL